MNKIKNSQIITLSDTKSRYFKEAIFILKDKVVAEDSKLLSEAIKIVSNFEGSMTKKKTPFLKILFQSLLIICAIFGIFSFFSLQRKSYLL